MKIRPNIAVIVTLVIITMAIYARTAYFPFCEIDDRDYVSDNIQVLSGLSADSIKWAFTTFHACNWHPVTWLSLMADSQLFGTDPMGYHLVNVAFHAATTALLFIFFNSATGALWRSAFVAACFALHPTHVESVVWISERKDVLSALFLMLTLIFYSDYVRTSKRGRYVLSLAAFTMGLMAKPMLVTVPVVLLLLDIWPFDRVFRDGPQQEETNTRHKLTCLLLEKMPYLALSIASSAITIYAQNHGGSVAPLAKYSIYKRISNALWSLLCYMYNTMYPVNLAIYYPMAPVPIWKAGTALLIICIILYFSVRKIRVYPWLATGWLWYLVTLLPVIGIIQVGGQAMADRYTYIPLIGLFAVVSWGGAELCAKAPKLRTAICLATAGILLFFSISTWFQVNYWQDNITLLTHATRITKDNYFASYALALAYEKQGNTERALEKFLESIASYPENPEIHLLYLHVGNILNGKGQSIEAVRHFAEAITRKPQFWQAHYNMGLALENLGRNDEAMSYYNEALKIEPDNAVCHNNIGRLLAKQGKLDEAIRHFSRALQLDPALETARMNLRLASEQKGQRFVK